MKFLRFGLLSFVLIFALTSCSGRKMYTAPAISAPVRAHDLEVRQAVRRALLNQGWVIEHDWAEATYAKVSHGRHSARVRVRYSGNRVHIEYVSSQYLQYRVTRGKPVIHKLYNNWVMSLENAIHTQIGNLQSSGIGNTYATTRESVIQPVNLSAEQYPDAYRGSYAGERHRLPVVNNIQQRSRIDVRVDSEIPAMSKQFYSGYSEGDQISEKDIIPSRMIQHNPGRSIPRSAVGNSRGAVNLDEIYY